MSRLGRKIEGSFRLDAAHVLHREHLGFMDGGERRSSTGLADGRAGSSARRMSELAPFGIGNRVIKGIFDLI